MLSFFPSLAGFAQESSRDLRHSVIYSKMYVSDFVNTNRDWVWEVDVVARRQDSYDNNNPFSEPLRMSIRPWIGFQFSPRTRYSFSPIGFFHNQDFLGSPEDADLPTIRELRSTFRFMTDQYLGKLMFTHRYMLESRWRDIDNQLGNGTLQNFRIRYRIRTRIPINKSTFFHNNVAYLVGFSELHLEFGRDHGTNFISQNRNYLGLGYRFWDWARVEAGYLHQYNLRGDLITRDISQGVMLYFFIDYLSALKASR
ncbi:MAG: DUF2490 domain-containing protein [Cyclobacteriaceae bacterium]|nr:DUF2490 domain-containing protein [Cyclobacteriaceae bacterium]MCH8515131.1 DUF2490 domain-containing protein [Cyclobacteriaceae bacterium]